MALLLTEVPIDFAVLFATVVLPAVALNAIAFVIIYPIMIGLIKRSNFKTSVSQA